MPLKREVQEAVRAGGVDVVLTCVVKVESPDVVGICDECDEKKPLYYGYSNQNGYPEAVIALCVRCGGKPENPWESEPSAGSDSDCNSE